MSLLLPLFVHWCLLLPPLLLLSHHQIHPGAFPFSSSSPPSFSSFPPSFSSSPPSSSEEGPHLNMGATGADFGRTSETSLKRHLIVYFSYCCCFFLYCFCNPPSVQACLSSSLYVVILFYINKSRYCFISHVLSLYIRNGYAGNRHTTM